MPAKGNHWRPPLRIFANQPTRSLWPLLHPNFISNYHWSMPIKHCVFSSVFNVKAPVCSRHFQPGEGSMSFLCLWMFHEPLFEALMVAWWCAEQDAGPAMWPWLGVTSPAAQPSPAPHKKLFIVNRQPPAEIFCPQLLRHLPVTEMSVVNPCRLNLRVLVFRDKYINITCSQLIQTNR